MKLLEVIIGRKKIELVPKFLFRKKNNLNFIDKFFYILFFKKKIDF